MRDAEVSCAKSGFKMVFAKCVSFLLKPATDKKSATVLNNNFFLLIVCLCVLLSFLIQQKYIFAMPFSIARKQAKALSLVNNLQEVAVTILRRRFFS